MTEPAKAKRSANWSTWFRIWLNGWVGRTPDRQDPKEHQPGTGDGTASPRPNPGKEIEGIVLAVTRWLILVVLVVSFLLGNSAKEPSFGVSMTALMLFTGALCAGAGLGFLFGLPRSRLGDLTTVANAEADKTKPAASGVTAAVSMPPSRYYLTNSNLNKVSDWLTTVVVGLGLVNIRSTVPALRELSAALQEPLGGQPYGGAAGLSLLFTGLFAGFLIMYLWTIIRVRALMEECEQPQDPGSGQGSCGDAKPDERPKVHGWAAVVKWWRADRP